MTCHRVGARKERAFRKVEDGVLDAEKIEECLPKGRRFHGAIDRQTLHLAVAAREIDVRLKTRPVGKAPAEVVLDLQRVPERAANAFFGHALRITVLKPLKIDVEAHSVSLSIN